MLGNHISSILGYDPRKMIQMRWLQIAILEINIGPDNVLQVSSMEVYSALKNEMRLNIAQVQKTFANSA